MGFLLLGRMLVPGDQGQFAQRPAMFDSSLSQAASSSASVLSGVPGIDCSGPGVGSHVDPGKRLCLAGSGGTTQSRGLLLHFPRVWAHGDSDLTPLLGGERPPLGSRR